MSELVKAQVQVGDQLLIYRDGKWDAAWVSDDREADPPAVSAGLAMSFHYLRALMGRLSAMGDEAGRNEEEDRVLLAAASIIRSRAAGPWAAGLAAEVERGVSGVRDFERAVQAAPACRVSPACSNQRWPQ